MDLQEQEKLIQLLKKLYKFWISHPLNQILKKEGKKIESNTKPSPFFSLQAYQSGEGDDGGDWEVYRQG